MVPKTSFAGDTGSATITDVDGTVYTVTWADDRKSAEVTTEDGVLCIVYATKRGAHTVWFSTDTIGAHPNPAAAIMATTAALRMKKASTIHTEETPSPAARPKTSWRDLVPSAKEKTHHHHRKDWE